MQTADENSRQIADGKYQTYFTGANMECKTEDENSRKQQQNCREITAEKGRNAADENSRTQQKIYMLKCGTKTADKNSRKQQKNCRDTWQVKMTRMQQM